MLNRYYLLLAGFFLFGSALAQNASIRGRVFNEVNNEPLPFATVEVENRSAGAVTDLDGRFEITNLPNGLYNLRVSFLGFETKTIYEVQTSAAKPANVEVGLSESSQKLQEVVVTVQDKFERKAEAPVSLQTIGINEIQRNPGGNQDISRVIQSLPGVASTVAFRNDLIIRGGGPNENRFYLDGIEIPNINHFATQGSSGGPVGMINVNFIREVDFYTSAFPGNRGNALSSVMDLKLKEGRSDRLGFVLQAGASDIGLTVEGPVGDKTTFLASARRSYLQFLFAALDLPFLPTYNDFQFKTTTRFNRRHQLTVLGLGAIDQFRLNLDANETPEQRYILNYLPVNEQWNYSIGAKYTVFGERGFTHFVLSRFMLNNTAEKFANNDENDLQLLDYQSQEIENKLRIEHEQKRGQHTFSGGIGLEEVKFFIDELDRRVPEGFEPRSYSSDLRLGKYALFGQYTTTLLKERLQLSAGFRADGINYNEDMANPLNQFSPRLALSYNLTDALSLNANCGIYYQLPPYTTLGFRDTAGALVNEQQLTYIRANHYVAGLAWYLPFNARVSLEGFLKEYSNYPFLLTDSISLANLGGDFGVIGNAPVRSDSKGRAYGLELTYQQKLFKGYFGILAFTLVRSEFEDKSGNLIPASWDNRYILTATAGKKFGKNWELGIQYQYLGGAPFTPFDPVATGLRTNWDVFGRALPNYNRLNSQRLEGFNRLNVRIDKKWYFNRWNLDIYLDIQNLLGDSVAGAPFLDTQKDANGDPLVDPNDPSRYLLTTLPNETGSVLPSIGVIIDF